MDFVANLFKKSKSKIISPEKQVQVCDNKNKSPHLFDMESTFLQDTVMIPDEFDFNQNTELDETINSNQENLQPRYSVLNSFDPIVRKATEESKVVESYNDNFVNTNVLDESLGENLVNLNDNASQSEKTFVNSIVEEFVEKAVEISTTFNDTINSCAIDVNKSSISNISTQSETSLLNNTVILNKPLTVENNTPNKNDVANSNKSLNVSSTFNQNLSFISTDDNNLDVGQDSSFSKKTSDVDINNKLLNVSTLEQSTDNNCLNKEENIKKLPNSPYVNDIFINTFANKLILSPILQANKTQINNINTDQILNKQIEITANESTRENNNEIITNLEYDSLLSSNDSNEVPHEISVESLKIVNELIEEQGEEILIKKNIDSNEIKASSDEQPSNEITVSSDEQPSNEINDSPKILENRNENILFELNNSNLQDNQIINDTVSKEEKTECFSTDENVSLEVTHSNTHFTEISNENTEQIKEGCYSPQLSNSTYENSITDSAENLITLRVGIEKTHMSASESNSDLNEPTVANRLTLESNAVCTNEMGEIINQNECFEKQTDITNGAIDNKESLEAKARVYKEMADKYSILEAEGEKYKIQVADLKKELKSCRQKTVALETEVADLKRRENELNILLEEYIQSTAIKGDVKEKDEQVHRLQVSEETLKNEVKELIALVKQHETHLKELQRKEVKLSDDLSCKTQSEMQISRVMEEYEKSISSLINENEKMKKERDTAQMHLANIEMAFSDVHQKYERCKAIVQGYKDNEESFKQDIAMNRETIIIQEQKYETLKAHAMAQLEKSNQELAAMKKQHETEMARLTAQLKRFEIKNMSLMESLQQKAKECEQLSAVCDEFIGNV